MSLFKQLFIAISALMLIYFAGSSVVSMESSRGQQLSQLESHAQDAATALGLSLSTHAGDPAMMELMVSSIFDSGYFQSIRIIAEADGQTLIERSGIPVQSQAPQWFANMVKLQPAAAQAYISDGWTAMARVQVTSHPVFAIDRLWSSALASLLVLALIGLLGLLLGALFLKRQLRPLDYLVRQAKAISQREFVNIEQLPTTPEFRRVVSAMNHMVDRLKARFDEEAARSEQLHADAYRDSLTGLPNRRHFDQQLSLRLSGEDQSSTGQLLVLQLGDLAQLNQQLGGQRTDLLIQDLAQRLRSLLPTNSLLARTRGGEFSLLVPGLQTEEATQLAITLLQDLNSLQQTLPQPCELSLHIGSTNIEAGNDVATLYRQLDHALTEAQSKNPQSGWACSQPQQQAPALEQQRRHWHQLLDQALSQNLLELFLQPVVHSTEQAKIWHNKVLARLPDHQGQLLAAGQILPWLERFGWMPRLDLAVTSKSLQKLNNSAQPLAISLSGQLLQDKAELQKFYHLLEQHKGLAQWVTFELDEDQLPAPDCLEAFATNLKKLGYGLALQHFGGRFSLIGNLARLGLNYLKVDGSYIRAIDQQQDKKLFIEAMQRAASSIELPLIAERVETQGESDTLSQLGISGMQGQLFGEPAPWQTD